MLLEDQGDDPVVKYTPPGINEGECHFVRRLRACAESEQGQALLDENDLELFLLRNQSRGRGVGFLIDGERYFPDFILWVKGRAGQDIVFIDPHGLITGGDLDVNPKVLFRDTIKDYEQKLNDRAGRDDVALHSYIISQTPFDELSKQARLKSRDEFHQRHIYFRGGDNYPLLLIEDVLGV